MKKAVVVFIAFSFGFNSFGQTTSNKVLKKSINELFESYAHYNRFVGSVLISKDDHIIYQKSYGYADLEGHKKNTEKIHIQYCFSYKIIDSGWNYEIS